MASEPEAPPIKFEFPVGFGIKKGPYLMVIYGEQGCGKSWLAANAESPFFIPVDRGACSVPDVGRYDIVPSCFEHARQMMMLLLNPKFVADRIKDDKGNPYLPKTIIIDGATHFNTLMTIDVIQRNPTISRLVDPSGQSKERKDVEVSTLRDYDYTEGYEMLLDVWERVMAGIKKLMDYGYNVIIISHSCPQKKKEITGDTTILNLDLPVFGHVRIPDLLTREADFVLFVDVLKNTKKRTADKQDKTVVNTAEPVVRVVRTQETGQAYAKFRAADSSKVPESITLDPEGNGARELFELVKNATSITLEK